MGKKTTNRDKMKRKIKQKNDAKRNKAKRFEILHRKFETGWIPKCYNFSIKQINLLMDEVALEIKTMREIKQRQYTL